MTEHPILFSAPMVRAILNGTKTQTRRVIAPQPFAKLYQYMSRNEWYEADGDEPKYHTLHKSLYGVTGDRLWVRETWALWGVPDTTVQIAYRVDESCATYQPPLEAANKMRDMYIAADERKPHAAEMWRPSIFMPRWASRITLEIVGVRAERVQDISEIDAMAEGIPFNGDQPSPRDEFSLLWESINAERGFGWDVNPWVWVIEFKRVA